MRRLHLLIAGVLLCVMFLNSGCANLTGRQASQWKYLQEHGIVTKPESHRSAIAAALMNLIPGLAELNYLDLDDNSPGGTQLVGCILMGPFFPVGWLWSIPLAIHNTGTANIQHTIKAHIHEIPVDRGGTLKTGPPVNEPLAEP